MTGRKVFGIGFQKTGTTSLAKALALLGYKVTGPNGVHDRRIRDNVRAMVGKLLKKYDAFQDNPWPVLFRELDAWCPGSKFILTLRPAQSWIRSVVRHFGTDTTPMREWIYGPGCPRGNEDVYVARYERHEAEVREYFHARPGDLLVLRITEGEGWEKLCPFLGKAIPAADFPHANRADERENSLGGRLARARERLARLFGRAW
jgi:sulfotransferase family protein